MTKCFIVRSFAFIGLVFPGAFALAFAFHTFAQVH